MSGPPASAKPPRAGALPRARRSITPSGGEAAFWAADADALIAELQSSPQGLTQAEASARLKQHGLNSVEDRRDLSALRLLIRQFESPLVLILVFGA